MTQSVRQFVRDRGDLSPSRVLGEVKESKNSLMAQPAKKTSNNKK